MVPDSKAARKAIPIAPKMKPMKREMKTPVFSEIVTGPIRSRKKLFHILIGKRRQKNDIARVNEMMKIIGNMCGA